MNKIYNLNKLLLMVGFLTIAFQAQSMEEVRELTKEGIPLPIEMKLHIIYQLAQIDKAKSLREVFRNLASLSKTNKELYNLGHSEAFIRTITKEYFKHKKPYKIYHEFTKAIKKSYIPVLKAILSTNINPNFLNHYSTRPLIQAASLCNEEIVKLLLDNDAYINVRAGRESDGINALISAVESFLF